MSAKYLFSSVYYKLVVVQFPLQCIGLRFFGTVCRLFHNIVTMFCNMIILFHNSISECTAERLDFMFLLICAIGELLTKDHHILPEVCDYVLCFLITCVQEHSEDHTSSIRTDLLYSRIFNLIVQFGEYFSSEIPAEAEKREWHEFFRPAFKDSLQPLYHNYLS